MTSTSVSVSFAISESAWLVQLMLPVSRMARASRRATAASDRLIHLYIMDTLYIMSTSRDRLMRARRACKTAKVEPVTFHQLRHTYASHLAQRVSLPIVG